MKYFDAAIDAKSKRDQDRELYNRSHTASTTKRTHTQAKVNQPIVDRKEDSPGKAEIGFLKPNGQIGSKFEVYNNLEALQKDAQKVNYASKQMKDLARSLANSNSKKKLQSTLSPKSKSPNRAV
jgi:hypothetical protein